MSSLSYVQEDPVNKVKEDLEFQVLAPRQTQVKEELGEPLELNQVGLLFLAFLVGSERACILTFDIDFPIFQGAFLGTRGIEIEYE